MATKPRAQTVPDDPVPTRRTCGTSEVHERLLRTVPGYAEARAEIENRTLRVLQAGGVTLRTGCTQIPVVVHVVYRNATENISDDQIHSQIAVLNQDYRAANPDRSSVPAVFAGLIGDPRVTFALATTDPSGNPTSGITRTSSTATSFVSDTDNVKSAATGGADPWPSDHYLNLWVCGNLRDSQGHALLGYAQFPGGPAATDGVVIVHTGFGNTGTASDPYNLGRTTTHEIGHWLNLRHIWGDDGSGCFGSDLVDDTPNQGGPNFGKPTFPHVSCSNGPNGDLFMNYMDYVDDAAMVMFTAGQVDRMQAALDGPRASVGVTGPCSGSQIKELVKDLPKDSPKDLVKDNPKDLVKDGPKDLGKDAPKDVIKDQPKDGPKDLVKDRPKDLVKDNPKDLGKDLPKDSPKDLVKDNPKDLVKDTPKDLGKDLPKDKPKDLIKDGPKELVKELAQDLPKILRDPQKDLSQEVPGPIGPGPVINPMVGAMPFVLGGRGDAVGAEDPVVTAAQAVAAAIAGYAQSAAAGTLDAAGALRLQQLSAVYAQLLGLLG